MSQHPDTLIYGCNDLPPWPRLLVYGLQWTIVFLPTIIIVSTIASDLFGFSPVEEVLFLQRLLLVTSAVMLVQTLWGHRYALLDGPASALLLSFIVLAPGGLPDIQGGMMIGGSIVVLLAALGWTRYVTPLFTDRVVGVILILVAITLLPYLATLMIGADGGRADGKPLTFAISTSVIVAVALFGHWLPGFGKTIPLFLGVLFGTLLTAILGQVDLAGLQEAAWISVPHPVVPGMPHFSLASTLSFLAAYVAVFTNALGSMYGIAEVVGDDELETRVERGILITGVGGILAGFCGVIGTVSYANGPGVVLLTRVATRFAVTACALFLLAVAFLHKLLIILAAIPGSVVAAAMATGLAVQLGAGISVLTRSGKALTNRDFLIIGIPVVLASVTSILPEGFFRTLPYIAHALLKNGLAVGIVAVLLLEHVLLRERESL